MGKHPKPINPLQKQLKNIKIKIKIKRNSSSIHWWESNQLQKHPKPINPLQSTTALPKPTKINKAELGRVEKERDGERGGGPRKRD